MVEDNSSTASIPSVTTATGSSISSLGMSMHLNRTTEINGLKTLKCPEEGGTKKEYVDFMEKIVNHVIITWGHGKDIAYVIKNSKLPTFVEPVELTDITAKAKLIVMRWDMEVSRHFAREDALKENSSALFSLVTESVSKITKSKLKSKTGFLN